MVSTTRPTSWRTERSRAGVPDGAAEVLLDDDVGRHLRPAGRDLDVLLLEEDLAAFAGDGGGAQLPLDLVERVDARRA